MEFIRTYKNMEIGEYAGLLGNSNFFELKLCQNITSAQTKNGSPSSLEFKRKNTLKIIFHGLN